MWGVGWQCEGSVLREAHPELYLLELLVWLHCVVRDIGLTNCWRGHVQRSSCVPGPSRRLARWWALAPPLLSSPLPRRSARGMHTLSGAPRFLPGSRVSALHSTG